MNELYEMLKEAKWIVVPLSVYHKIIPVEDELLEDVLKELIE